MGNGMIATAQPREYHDDTRRLHFFCLPFLCTSFGHPRAHSTAWRSGGCRAAGIVMLVIFLGGVMELNQSSLLNENV